MRLYKHHITPYLQVLLVLCALATLASCVSDKFWEQLEASRNPEPETTPYYLSLKIMDTSGSPVATTRAWDGYVDGSGAEHKVGESGNYVILLNSDKDNRSLYGVYPLQLYRWDVDYKDDNTKEVVYTTRFYHDESKPLPEYGLVVLNANGEISDWLEEELKKLEDTNEKKILEKRWDDEDNPKNIGFALNDGDNSSLFTMTNSAYVKDGKVKVAENIEGHIAKSIEEARKNCVTVYVERLVAKFTFKIADDAINFAEGEENIFQPSKEADIVFFTGFSDEGATQYKMKKWRIEVTGWNVNAFEKKTHLFKNITADPTNSLGYPDGTWNEADRHRSYWSEDPDYENPNYPWQFRQSIDHGQKGYKERDEERDKLILQNYSFDSLKLGKQDDNSDEGNSSTQFTDLVYYAPEHTYNATITAGKLDGREELLAGTHLLVGAELQFEKDEEEGEYEVGNWYRDRSGIYYRSEKEYFAAQMHAFAQLLTSQEYMEFTLYDWGSYGEPDSTWIANTSGEYKLYFKTKNGESQPVDDDFIKKIMDMTDEEFTQEIGKMAEATLLRNDGKCAPWLEGSDQEIGLEIKNENGDPLAIHERKYDNIGAVIVGEWNRPADPNDIKSLLYEWLGSADHFTKGKMYYATGIYSPTASKQTNCYGVVRNTWYQFTLDGINSIGIPVDSPAQPIVPDQIGHEDKTNVSIKILDWHKFETTIDSLPK